MEKAWELKPKIRPAIKNSKKWYTEET
jgi:hypothetical protein